MYDNSYVKTIQPKPTYKVSDPFTNQYNVDWVLLYDWILLYDCNNRPNKWVPVW
jgi:hypothetical protein